MDIDEQALGPIHKKRAHGPSDDDLSDEDEQMQIGKRMRLPERSDNQYLISPREAFVFDAVGMLHHVAMTSFYVTANFSKFNHFESQVLLYFTSGLGPHYEVLW